MAGSSARKASECAGLSPVRERLFDEQVGLTENGHTQEAQRSNGSKEQAFIGESLCEKNSGTVEREEKRAGARDEIAGGGAAAVRFDAPCDDRGEGRAERERCCIDARVHPVREETAIAPAPKPADAEHDAGPEAPAEDGERLGAGTDDGGLLAERVCSAADDEGVGHDEPDGEYKAKVEVRRGHLAGVNEPEHDEADSGDILPGGIEEECSTGDEQRDEHRKRSKRGRAEHGGGKRQHDQRDGRLKGEAS